MPIDRFIGRTAVITGGARGIGLASAGRLLAEGANILLLDLDVAALEAASSLLGQPDRVAISPLDVTDAEAQRVAMAMAVTRFGSLDILIASAGITGPTAPSWQIDDAAWRSVVDVNLTGVFLSCAAAVPYMIRGGWGRIVNVASIGGKEGNARAAAYAASKGGVIAFTKALGKELVEHDIRANCICPAALQTDILKQMPEAFVDQLLAKIPLGRFGTAEEVASLITWMCSDECSFCTGAVFDASGGRATY